MELTRLELRFVTLIHLFGVTFFATTCDAQLTCWAPNSGGNGHCYQLVLESVQWTDARAAALWSSLIDELGYLATITSQAENDFIVSSFESNTTSYAWLGGTDQETEGTWRWADGPEAGIQFSQGGTPTTPSNFANWSSVEPNNSDGQEHYAVLQLGSSSFVPHGGWGVDPRSGAGQVGAYIVEYNVPEPTSSIYTIAILLCLVRTSRWRRSGPTRS